MELEDLVPPMELCKQIPEGKFEGSVFAWALSNGNLDYVEYRDTLQVAIGSRIIAPAPTLQEIIDALPTYIEEHGKRFYLCLFDARNMPSATFQIGYARAAHHGLEPSELREKDANLATAALKLWLEANKPDIPDRTDRKEEECGK